MRKVEGLRVREVKYRERSHPTMIRDETGDDMPASGRFWIEPQRGTVVRSELVIDLPIDLKQPTMVGVRSSVARIRVDYRHDPNLDLWVPATMQEDYPGANARARYDNYRRFTVTTHEAIGLSGPVEKAPQWPGSM